MFDSNKETLKVLSVIKSKIEQLSKFTDDDDFIAGRIFFNLDDFFDCEIEEDKFVSHLKMILKKFKKEKLIKGFCDSSNEEIEKADEKDGSGYLRPFAVFYEKDFIKKSNLFINKINKNRSPFKSNSIIPIKLPINTTWEEITLKFKNDYDIEIWYQKKYNRKSNNVEMGFAKGKNGVADKQWEFLKSLSVSKGKFDLKPMAVIKQEKFRKYKEKLSARLKYFFSIDTDPFITDKKAGTYKTKFLIEPIPVLRGDGEIYGAGEEDKKYYKEQLNKKYLP